MVLTEQKKTCNWAIFTTEHLTFLLAPQLPRYAGDSPIWWPRCRTSRRSRRGRRSTHSLEGVADGRWIPAAAALCSGDAIGVQSVRDRGQALPGGSLAPDPLARVRGHARGPAEPNALRAFCRERAPYALRVEPPLERGEGGEHAHQRLPGGRLRLPGCSRGRRARSPASARSRAGPRARA